MYTIYFFGGLQMAAYIYLLAALLWLSFILSAILIKGLQAAKYLILDLIDEIKSKRA